MAEKCFPSIQRLRNLDIDAETWNKFINGEIDETNLNRQGIDVETLVTWRSRVIEIAQQAAGMQTYLTKAKMEAAQPQPEGVVAQVTNDPDLASNGYWVSNGAVWVWSGLQPPADSRLTTFKRVLSDGTDLNHIATIGTYGLSSTSSYLSLPLGSEGQNCQLIVEPVTGDAPGYYVLQRLTVTLSPNKSWVRRVLRGATPAANTVSPWTSELRPLEDALVRMTVFRGILPNNTNLNHIGQIGVYALVSSSTYVFAPIGSSGQLCQLVVEPINGENFGYALQTVISSVSPNTRWTRRVLVGSDPENNVADNWSFSLDPAELAEKRAIDQSLHHRFGGAGVPSGTPLANMQRIGCYTVRSTNTYPDIPEDLVGLGCVLEVFPVDAGISMQRITSTADPRLVYSRRVIYGSTPENNSPGPWFKQSSNDVIDFSALPLGERRIASGDAWNNKGVVTVKTEWGALYVSPTTSIIGDLTKLYGVYDGLMAEFPEYVTRETIGVDGWGLPIYQYLFSPPLRRMYEHPSSVGKRPKIILTSGTHGGERGAQMGLLIFVDNLCKNWRTLPDYNALRWSVDFVVIPATIPSSVEDASRKNRNGVDCNRNFDWKWGQGNNPSPDPESPMYQGPSAASEVEVQVLQEQIPVRHSDAILLLENHNHNNPQAFWIGSNSPSAMHIGLEAADRVTPYLWNEIVPDGDLSKTTQYVTKNYEGSFAGYMEAAGIPAILIETSGDLNFGQNDGTVTSLRRLHELLILNVVKVAIDKEMRKRAENWDLV